jgi:uncharacterized delta-60 repeat protein
MKWAKKKIKILFLFLVIAHALDGQLYTSKGFFDRFFNHTGYFTDFVKGYYSGKSAQYVTILNDGKILCIYTYSFKFYYFKLLKDGRIDESFGAHGVVEEKTMPKEFLANGILKLKSGKWIVYGIVDYSVRQDLAMIRYNEDGSLDKTFADNGKWVLNIWSKSKFTCGLELENGDLLMGGRTITNVDVNLLMRFHSDGQIDSSYGENGMLKLKIGKINNWLSSIFLLPKADVYLNGMYEDSLNYCFHICKVDKNGKVDSSFGVNGIASYLRAQKLYHESSAALHPDLSIYQTALVGGKYQIVHILSNGMLDLGFGKKGVATVPLDSAWYKFNVALFLQADSNLILNCGVLESARYRSALAKFNPGGIGIADFGYNGITLINHPKVTNYFVSSSAMQKDGKIVNCGFVYENNISARSMIIGRFETNSNTNNNIFFQNGITVAPNPVQSAFTIYFQATESNVYSIGLYDLNGRKVMDLLTNYWLLQGKYNLFFTLPVNVTAGIYVLRVTTENGLNLTNKLLIE